MKGKILSVQKNSLAEEIELKAGDSILEINGRKIRDIIELSFELAVEEVDLLIEHSDGEREIIEFEKDINFFVVEKFFRSNFFKSKMKLRLRKKF